MLKPVAVMSIPLYPEVSSLAVSGTTCRITGTPGIESISGDYIITATNATGPNTITVNLTVTVPVSIDKVQLTSSGEPAPIKGDVLTLAFETTGQTNFDPQVRIGGQLADVIAGGDGRPMDCYLNGRCKL